MTESPVLAETITAADQIREQVLTSQDAAMAAALVSRGEAMDAMNEIAAFMPQLRMNGTPPAKPVLVTNISETMDLPDIEMDKFGVIDVQDRADVSLNDVGTISVPDIDDFHPEFSAIHIPEAPARTTFVAPTKPLLDDIVYPADLADMGDPALPQLLALTLPTYAPPVFAPFSAVAPSFTATEINPELQWGETIYVTELVEELATKLRAMWAGGTGLPAAVEAALWERAASREDMAVSRDISAATIEFASRGFTLPPGMLVARIDAIREDSQVKKLALGREILIKIADTEIENLRFACTTSIAAEQVLVGIWDSEAKRKFEAAKITLDSQLATYNAQVALFNARQSAYSTEANVFKILVDAELAELEGYKAQIQAEVAKGQANESAIKVYEAQSRTLLTKVEAFKARMESASIQSTVQKTRMDAYRSEVEAFAALLNADKTKFDAYDSQVKGEMAKAQVIEAQARAYAAYVSGQATKVDASAKNQAAKISNNEMLIRQFVANVEKDKVVATLQLGAITAAAEAHRTNTTRYTAKAGVEQARIETLIKSHDAEMNRNIQLYEVEIRKYVADMEQLIRVAGIQLEAMKAASQAASTLAAGAMAGISISSGVSSSAGLSASGSGSVNYEGKLNEPPFYMKP